MKNKGNAHGDLLFLFQWTGVTYHLIVDVFKEQVLVPYKKNFSNEDCRLKQTRLYSLWQNATEGKIRDLKRRAGRNMTKSRRSKQLSDH